MLLPTVNYNNVVYVSFNDILVFYHLQHNQVRKYIFICSLWRANHRLSPHKPLHSGPQRLGFRREQEEQKEENFLSQGKDS